MAGIKSGESKIIPNMETLCRLCLNSDSGTFNIFELEPGQLPLPMRIMACAAVEVHELDDLPKLICANCKLQLEAFYDFRKMCQLSDAKLRVHASLLKAGKESQVFSELEIEDTDEYDREVEIDEPSQLIDTNANELTNDEEEDQPSQMDSDQCDENESISAADDSSHSQEQIPNDSDALISNNCTLTQEPNSAGSSEEKKATKADQAKKKQKTLTAEVIEPDNPVYPHSHSLSILIGKVGDDPRLTKADNDYIQEKLVKLLMAENLCFRGDRLMFADGLLLIRCINHLSYAWLVDAVPKIPPFGDVNFRIIDVLKPTQAYCWIPGAIKDTKYVLDSLRELNPDLNTSRWKVYSHLPSSFRTTKQGSTLILGLDPGSAETIKTKYKMRLRLYTGRVLFRFSSKQREGR